MEVTAKGLNFVQEDSPHEIGVALAEVVREMGDSFELPKIGLG